jgi:hypothetical protein
MTAVFVIFRLVHGGLCGRVDERRVDHLAHLLGHNRHLTRIERHAHRGEIPRLSGQADFEKRWIDLRQGVNQEGYSLASIPEEVANDSDRWVTHPSVSL